MAGELIAAGAPRVRHIVPGDGPGAVEVLGRSYEPHWLGEWLGGTITPVLNKEGTFKLVLSKTGSLMARLQCLREYYRPGDEWFEVWEDGQDQPRMVVTPTKPIRVTPATIELEGYDALWLLKLTRENQAGYWAGAHLDAWLSYTSVWQADYADDFTETANAKRESGGGATVANGICTLPGQGAWVGRDRSTPLGDEGDERIDITLTIPSTAATVYVRRSVLSGASPAFLRLDATGVTWRYGTLDFEVLLTPTFPINRPFTITFDRSRGVTYVSLDGVQLDGLVSSWGGLTSVLRDDATGGHVVVHSITYRRKSRLLLDLDSAGSARLPATPPAGGLSGSYHSMIDFLARDNQPAVNDAVQGLFGDPDATRIDLLDFTVTGNPIGWVPAGIDGEGFAVIWTGAIALDLAKHDYSLRITCGSGDWAALEVGRSPATSTSEAVITLDTSYQVAGDERTGTASQRWTGSLRDWLDTSESGWYPVKVMYYHAGDPPNVSPHENIGGIVLDCQVDGGAYAALTSASLSPYGCFTQRLNNQSHYDALMAIAEDAGYQFALEPRSLESGEFPGRLIPRARVGRDTAAVLRTPDVAGIVNEIDAEDVADALQAGAAGIADPGNAAQLTAEAFNFDEIDQHLFITQQSVDLGQITDPGLLAQRLRTLLTLRGPTWSDVTAQPTSSRRGRVDTWPLTQELAEFDLGVGDGMRRQMPEYGVVDLEPVQIASRAQDFTPDGWRLPQVSFRQRPRNDVEAFRSLAREIRAPRRTYQGQLTLVPGVPTGRAASDAGLYIYTKPALPAGARVTRIVLQVRDKTESSEWEIVVGATFTGITVVRNGEYDITAWGGPSWTTLSPSTSWSAAWTIQLLVTARI